MARFVALFRGINVGKAKRIAMADLRQLFESLGYTDVKTLLNSGNVVFAGAFDPPIKQAQRIQASVAAELGVDSFVLVKSAKEIAAIVANNILTSTATDPSRLVVAMTTDAKTLAALKAWAEIEWQSESAHLGKHAAYLWCPSGVLESKAAVALLKGLANSGTTRNWATIQKLNALLSGSD